ncbi:HAD family hydrolase [Aliidiomarina soli]|uniref:HAD family hydrolase n=1 Tax=Aliidiomarina soli TaxID=1928574 RepID=A0A432WMU7_9GAMM|nr:HAD-IA family hydrolase [Aliidiomarina soli]RUO35017.1 HAD family hydrolase [Aliidiomarina soli]
MQYKLVIFDWDGTLMDSVPRIVSSLKSLAQHCQLPVPSTEAIHDIIGLSLPIALERLFDCHGDEAQQALIDVYRDFYVERDTTPTPMFDGATATLDYLKQSGYQLAVATGKARPGLQRAWLASDTEHFFLSSRCAKEVPSKPHPAMLEEILEETGFAKEEAVMVGDSIHDLMMAQNAGVDSIGVTYGVHSKERLQSANPKLIINAVAELRQHL